MSRGNVVEESIKKIGKAYALGETILVESQKGEVRGKSTRLSEKYKVPEEMVKKLRVLANPRRGFSRVEMQKQFSRFRRKGKSLKLSHFIRLLALPRGQTRNVVMNKALEENLSPNRLQEFIRSIQPNPRHWAGRKPKVAVTDNFDDLVGCMVRSWKRVLEAHLRVYKITNLDLKAKVTRMKRLMDQIAPIETKEK